MDPIDPAALGPAINAQQWFAFELAKTFMEKGLLTPQEAAAIMVRTAEKMRAASEDEQGPAAPIGEALARSYEQMGEWLLGGRSKLT